MPAIAGWYQNLNKPSFNPPDWIFAPVWIVLFFLMGISLFLIWRKETDLEKSRKAIHIFGIQLILNVCWSIIFFGFKAINFAFIEIVVLWFAILYTIIVFYKISKISGLLLAPYLLWVSFALILNFVIWAIN